MREPTEEQIKEFWEKFGWHKTGKWWISQTLHKQRNRLTVNFPNLIKYAVPIIIATIATELEIHFDYLPQYDKWNCQLGDGFYDRSESKYNLAVATGDTLVLSLFWAIDKIREA